jgi:oligopeptide/dipeptide ABC transporter ATP-binding protein
MRPDVILADEPVSALDVSVQAQILNLFIDLREEYGLTYLFISHDFNVVRYVCDRIAVMYLGRIVESGTADAILAAPQHPYTQALVSSVPQIGASRSLLAAPARGELPSALRLPSGCRYHPRCQRADDICRSVEPLLEVAPNRSMVACHFPGPALEAGVLPADAVSTGAGAGSPDAYC